MAYLDYIIITIIIIIGSIVAYLIIIFGKSHRLRIRDPLSSNAYILDYWVIEKKDKETGVIRWVSVPPFPKLSTEKPPQAAIDVGKKGKMYAEAYRLSEDEYIWISDERIELKKRKDDEGRTIVEILDKNIDGTEEYIDTFKPFSIVQRDSLIHQYIKAEEIGKKRWTTGEIAGMISVGALVVVIVVGFIFGADILAEYNKIQSLQVSQSQAMADLEKLQVVREAILAQEDGVDLSSLNLYFAQAPPQQQGKITNAVEGGNNMVKNIFE